MTSTPIAAKLAQALRELEEDISDRFDMDSPSTNPGMKHAVNAAREALREYDDAKGREDQPEAQAVLESVHVVSADMAGAPDRWGFVANWDAQLKCYVTVDPIRPRIPSDLKREQP